ncbi:MAG: hypothetical protein JOS17DRAFT_286512 [Linnemannia elongata]|nr:MAG: hypothetical protein JOS17DRAFT_286512 [Linnemannia elongata]
MAAMSISTTASLYNPEPVVKYDLISTSLFCNSTTASSKPAPSTITNNTVNSLRKSLALQRLHMGPPHRSFLPQSRQHQQQPLHHSFLHQIQHNHLTHKKTQSTHLADKLEDIMSSPLLIAPLLKKETTATSANATTSSVSYVYTAPCEHHPSTGQTDYLVNDMFPKLTVSNFISLATNQPTNHPPPPSDPSTLPRFFSVTHTSSHSFFLCVSGWLDPEFGLFSVDSSSPSLSKNPVSLLVQLIFTQLTALSFNIQKKAMPICGERRRVLVVVVNVPGVQLYATRILACDGE